MKGRMMSQSQKKVFEICGIVWIGILAIYLAGCVLFYGRFLLFTSVNGTSITLLSPEEVTVDRMQATGRRTVTFVGKDGSYETALFRDLGIYCESDNYFVDMKLPSWLWFTSIWKHTEYELSDELFYNRETMKETLEHLTLVTNGENQLPSDVYLEEVDGEFVIVQKNDGFLIDTDRLLEVLCEHVEAHNFVINLEDEDCYVKSGETNSDANFAAKNQHLKELQSLEIQIQMNTDVVEQLPSSVLELAVYQDENDTVMLRPSVVSSYVAALAEKYDTKGMTRLFHTSDRTTLALKSGVNDTFLGYELDQDLLLVSLLNQISNGDSTLVQAPWYSVGREFLNDSSDIGDTYIEISIGKQHLWYYQDGSLILDTDVVTGMDTEERRTPIGLFYVMNLNTNYTMYYSDGSALCSYFIKVTADGVGIHDSTRTAYGGSIYQTNGSHGCINVPYAAEQQLFASLLEMEDVHIPVIIYE